MRNRSIDIEVIDHSGDGTGVFFVLLGISVKAVGDCRVYEATSTLLAAKSIISTLEGAHTHRRLRTS